MVVTDLLSGPLPESAHRVQLRRAVVASNVGTTIEWYDFLLYSVSIEVDTRPGEFTEVRIVLPRTATLIA
jgi:hypothetical protein